MVKSLGDRFWEIVDSTVDDDRDRQIDALSRALDKLSLEQILAFDRDFHAASKAAYRWDLWGAAYVLNGGCSDDGFTDFRAWLISRGRAVYEAALADPESLSDHVDPEDAAFEEFAYVPIEVYEQKTGEDFPYEPLTYPSEPSGEEWSEEDLDTMFPKLTQRVRTLG